MMAVATAAVAIDGLDPVLLVPLTCLIVGLLLGTFLGFWLRDREVGKQEIDLRQEVDRYRTREKWLVAQLDDADAKVKRRTCTPVEVPE